MNAYHVVNDLTGEYVRTSSGLKVISARTIHAARDFSQALYGSHCYPVLVEDED